MTTTKGNPVARFFKNPYVGYIIFGILVSSVPFLAAAGIMRVGMITTLASVIIYSIAALGLNLLLGYSGSISLATAGFMGLGAYIGAYFTRDMGLSFLLGILVAMLVPTVIGILVGFISLRISGLYLAIATLCVSEILSKTFEQATAITGGMRGVQNVPWPSLFGFRFGRTETFILLTVILVIIMILTHNLVKGHLGRAFNAMRGSDVAAAAMGVNLLKYRLVAFALATAYAGLAGALHAFYLRSVFPTSWDLNLSLFVLAAVVIGGFRSIYGTIIGAYVVFAVPPLLQRLPVIGDIPGLPFIFNGVLIIVVILFYPHGLIHVFYDARRLLKKLLAKGGARNVR